MRISSQEIQRKLRFLNPEDMKKINGFFYLVETGDKQATEIWSMANDPAIEPKQVADLIFTYMDFIYEQIMPTSHSSPAGSKRDRASAIIDKRYGHSGS